MFPRHPLTRMAVEMSLAFAPFVLAAVLAGVLHLMAGH